jgi:hypothetical protein
MKLTKEPKDVIMSVFNSCATKTDDVILYLATKNTALFLKKIVEVDVKGYSR